MNDHRNKNLFARRGLAAVLLRLSVALAACSTLLFLTSCSESQRLTVAADGSGTAEVEVTLAPMLVSYLHDLMASMAGADDNSASGAAAGAPPIFDLERVRTAFGQLPGVSGLAVDSTSEGSLSLRFAFRSLRALLEGPQAAGGSNPITLSTSGGATTIRFYLDRENLQALTSLPPLRDNPLLLALVPKGTSRVTEEQELELLDYAFGDYAPRGSTVGAVVRASAIRVSLRVEGQIVSQRGGTQAGNTVVFTLPLLRLLTLEQPVDYAVTYR